MSLPPDPHDGDRRTAPITPAVSGPPPSPAYAPVQRPVTYASPPDSDDTDQPPADDDRTETGSPTEAAAGDDPATTGDFLGPPRRRPGLPVVFGAVVAMIVVVAGAGLTMRGSDGGAGGERQTDADRETAGDASTGTSSGAETDRAAPGTTARAVDEPAVETTEALIAAVEAGDCAGIIGRLTPESYGPDGQTANEAVAECEAGTGVAAALSAADFGEVTLVDASGDRATVSIVVTLGGQANERSFPVHRINGRWRLDVSSLTADPSPSA